MGRPTRYPPPFRARAIAYVTHIRADHPSTWQAIKTVADALGISAETLRRWIRHADTTPDQHRQSSRHQAELRHLHEQNTRLRQELYLLRASSTNPAPSLTADPTAGATPPSIPTVSPRPAVASRPGPAGTLSKERAGEPTPITIPHPATPDIAANKTWARPLTRTDAPEPGAAHALLHPAPPSVPRPQPSRGTRRTTPASAPEHLPAPPP
ncbi:transposase [Frankia sp. R43]|uniref:transposase n=1 Tax=Frankia sp. R43 TaxID=269536 RepID=UPI0006C9FAA6|nr:transposase [Frankia sp. R43]